MVQLIIGAIAIVLKAHVQDGFTSRPNDSVGKAGNGPHPRYSQLVCLVGQGEEDTETMDT